MQSSSDGYVTMRRRGLAADVLAAHDGEGVDERRDGLVDMSWEFRQRLGRGTIGCTAMELAETVPRGLMAPANG